ncbi:flagellar protein FliT [Salinisphaera sp. Q1T1-3]|uniref:flagellar protein FliT n=1 Tax=Salinisphaera sp. Q1T1-3 TaxID=2321229 RepID=UPI00131405EC|nr:flagellar protein FliT [Salinisphaera sp. Q1T1-3]
MGEHAESNINGDILDRYEIIRSYMRVMQQYARAGEWDHLVELQTTYVRAVEDLAEAESEITLSEDAGDRKRILIEEIQAAEADVRHCLNQRMTELSALMGDSRQRQFVARAYESQAHEPDGRI